MLNHRYKIADVGSLDKKNMNVGSLVVNKNNVVKCQKIMSVGFGA